MAMSVMVLPTLLTTVSPEASAGRELRAALGARDSTPTGSVNDPRSCNGFLLVSYMPLALWE